MRHARAPGVRVGFAFRPHPLRQQLFQDLEHALTQRQIGVKVLQPAQQLRDVITGFRVEDNVGDIRLTELHLGIDDGAHGIFA